MTNPTSFIDKRGANFPCCRSPPSPRRSDDARASLAAVSDRKTDYLYLADPLAQTLFRRSCGACQVADISARRMGRRHVARLTVVRRRQDPGSLHEFIGAKRMAWQLDSTSRRIRPSPSSPSSGRPGKSTEWGRPSAAAKSFPWSHPEDCDANAIVDRGVSGAWRTIDAASTRSDR